MKENNEVQSGNQLNRKQQNDKEKPMKTKQPVKGNEFCRLKLFHKENSRFRWLHW